LNELEWILNAFFDDMPEDVLLEGFGDLLRRARQPHGEALAIEKAFLYLQPKSSIRSIYERLGLKKLFRLLANPTARELLRRDYAFDYRTFHELSGSVYPDEGIPAAIRSAGAGRKDGEGNGGAGYVLALTRRQIGMWFRGYPLLYRAASRVLWFLRRIRP